MDGGRRGRQHLTHRRAGELLHLADDFDVSVHDGEELLANWRILRNRATRLDGSLGPLLHDRSKHVDLRVEVVVDRALGEAGRDRDVVNPGGIQAFGSELGGGRIEQSPPMFDLGGFADPRHCTSVGQDP